MEDDEDDIYGDSASAVVPAVIPRNGVSEPIKEEPVAARESVMTEVDDEEDEDEDDSDSDIDIIVERKEGAADTSTKVSNFERAKAEPIRISADPATIKRERDSTTQPRSAEAPGKKLTVKDGSKYPGVHTSKLDLDQTPIYESAGKPITEIDLDADVAMDTKPWRVPGTDPTDFFNYGFDEFTWVQYCLKQKQMRENVNGLKSDTKHFEAMLTGQPPPGGMPSMPAAAGDMPPEMMNAMFGQMQAQGITDPSQLDFNAFMQNMQQMGMMPGGQPAPGGFGQFGGAQAMQQQVSGQGFPHHGGTTPQALQQTSAHPEDFSGWSDQQANLYKQQQQQQQQQGGYGNRRARGRGRY